jgi:hypothetical protein
MVEAAFDGAVAGSTAQPIREIFWLQTGFLGEEWLMINDMMIKFL